MPLWLSVIIPIAVAALTIAVNAVVNIKIKFAPDATAATRELKELALRVVQWLLNFGMVGVLIRDILSTEPLTRLAVFKITLDVATLGLVVVSYLIHRVLDVIKRIVEVQAQHLGVTEKIRDALRSEQTAED
ncbi:MAG: hypothetical protein M3495_03145 [Pseudomonadota bacterium]|nr:hypothetical protein [Pseudomonadota bacterium]